MWEAVGTPPSWDRPVWQLAPFAGSTEAGEGGTSEEDSSENGMWLKPQPAR